MGNRGILHTENGVLTRRRWRHKAWVCCLLSFKGAQQDINAPGRYTQLFFHDEAVSFAAGHRPCNYCRRQDSLRFRETAGITGKLADFDTRLHTARAVPRVYGQRRHQAQLVDLPDGAFIFNSDGRPALVLGDALHPFHPKGYMDAVPRRGGTALVTVLTPEPLLDALRGGYRPALRLS